MTRHINSGTVALDQGRVVHAKAPGYTFSLYEEKWDLDKNTTIYLSDLQKILCGELLKGCLETLAFFATNHSAGYVYNLKDRFRHFLVTTKAQAITDVALINYRSSLSRKHEWYLATVRTFLKKWYRLGYPGVGPDVIRLLDSWKLKGNRKGDAVKRRDPLEGPYTDIELQAFNEGVIRAFESDVISLSDLALSLLVSNTGRRPIQISHIRLIDLSLGENQKNEEMFLIDIPRAKHGDGFRASKQFKTFAITEELWVIVCAQAMNAVKLVESKLGFALQEADKAQVPLFPDLKVANKVRNASEFREIAQTDKLHIKAEQVTDVLQTAGAAAEVQSERTNNTLNISSRRFRYTFGTRAAREGHGDGVIAELLDHVDNQNSGVYVKNNPEHVKKLDEAIGFQMATYAQAFAGVLVDSENQASRGDDSTSRIRSERGNGIGTCGEYGFCGANVPIPCYTCMHFQPWLDGPHEEVYKNLLSERTRIFNETGDLRVAEILDRSIIAVAEVIKKCAQRRKDMGIKKENDDG